MTTHANDARLIEDTVESLRLLSTKVEVADFLRCHVNQVSRLIDAGELRAMQRRRVKGSTVLIPRASIREYLMRISR